MFNLKSLLFIVLCGFTSLVFGQRPNFSEDIAHVVYTKCGSCHRAGEIAPMPLTNYEQIKSMGQAIKFVTQTGYMPPWKADPAYGHYLNENVLTDWEKEQISRWVDAGMPEGDPQKAPAFPTFPEGSQLGTPDLVLSMAQAFKHAGNNKDNYRIFVLPTGLTQDQEIAAIEFRPGNKNICHHAIIGLDTTGQGRKLDAADPGYGYAGFGGFGFNVANSFVGGWVPGFKTQMYPDGFSKKLFKGSDLLVQMHYAPNSQDETDSSVINIFFAKKKPGRIIETIMLNPSVLTNGPFIIPANEVKEFHGQVTIPGSYSLSLYSVLPHSHLLGKSWWIYAVKPGGDTLPIVRVPKWDFHWQMEYIFPKFLKIPGGSTIHMHAAYDNTDKNPENPNHPPKTVTFGESTTDEMFIVFFSTTLFLPGDEQIALNVENGKGLADELSGMRVYPNPARDVIHVMLPSAMNSDVTITLRDALGRTVQETVYSEDQIQSMNLDFPILRSNISHSGFYLLECRSESGIWRKKVWLE
jgi:hypothetical protein